MKEKHFCKFCQNELTSLINDEFENVGYIFHPDEEYQPFNILDHIEEETTND